MSCSGACDTLLSIQGITCKAPVRSNLHGLCNGRNVSLLKSSSTPPIRPSLELNGDRRFELLATHGV